MADHDTLVLQLLEFVPGASSEQATQYLSANNWDLDAAAASLLADMDEAEDDAVADDAPAAATSSAPPEYTGPRTLDGRPAPQSVLPTSSNKTSRPHQKKTGLATLSSLGGGGHSHDHDDEDDDDDDDDDDERGPRDTYAGGEKSGLALQDPNKRSTDPRKIINDLMKQAKS